MTSKRYRVTILEWLSHDVIIEAPDAATARKRGLDLWHEDTGNFHFVDSGLDELQCAELADTPVSDILFPA